LDGTLIRPVSGSQFVAEVVLVEVPLLLRVLGSRSGSWALAEPVLLVVGTASGDLLAAGGRDPAHRHQGDG
jgi:hypothetical protein